MLSILKYPCLVLMIKHLQVATLCYISKANFFGTPCTYTYRHFRSDNELSKLNQILIKVIQVQELLPKDGYINQVCCNFFLPHYSFTKINYIILHFTFIFLIIHLHKTSNYYNMLYLLFYDLSMFLNMVTIFFYIIIICFIIIVIGDT